MKIICQQKEFSTHLAIASRAVPTLLTHPILGSILLEANTGQVTLTGFDLNLGITTTFDAEVMEPGRVAIPAKLLRDIVSQLPGGEITLSWEPSLEENEDAPILIELTTASGKFQFSGSLAEEFPKLPVARADRTIEIPASVLVDGMKVLFAVSKDETKQVLLGVNITWDVENIKFAATDGHRLAVVNTAKDESPELYEQLNSLEIDNITIHHYALEQLKAILVVDPDPEQDYLIELQIEEDQLMFHTGDQKLYCRKISGKYPAYEQIIPQQFCRKAIVNRKEMLAAVKLVSILSSDDCGKAVFDSNSGQISLAVDAQDVGSGTQSVSAEITGEPIEIGFNLKYLISVLTAIDSTEVKIQANETNTPVIISPLGGLDMTALIMPVGIRG